METSDIAGQRTSDRCLRVGRGTQLAPQNDQLMSERGILSLKPDLRLEWRGKHGQNEADQRDHRANLADSIIR